MKKIFIFLSILCLHFVANAQVVEYRYLNKKLNHCKAKRHAKYIHKITWDNDTKVSCKDKIMRLDSSLYYMGGYANFEKRIRRQSTVYFYENGHVKTLNKYSLEGKKKSRKTYFGNGKIRLSKTYNADGFNYTSLGYSYTRNPNSKAEAEYYAFTNSSNNKLKETRFDYKDSLKSSEIIFDRLPNNKLRRKKNISFYENGNIFYEEFYNKNYSKKKSQQLSVRDSTYSYFENGNLKRKEYYSANNKIKNVCFLENGDLTKYTPFTINAEYPGGENKMLRFLGRTIQYPRGTEDIEGIVHVRFAVCTDGEICDFEVTKSVEKRMDTAVIRAIKKMPNWIPGKTDGKKVKTYFTLPVQFKHQY